VDLMTVTQTILSANRSDNARPMPPRLVVIHTTESNETTGGAIAIARFFQPEPADKSAHLVVDDTDTVRVVPDRYQAYTALGANEDGLHVEIVGKAGQGTTGWADAYSQAALRRAADAVRTWCNDYGIPVRQRSTAEVKAGWRGICGHVNISEAYHLTDHTDPGPTFPWDQFIALIQGDDDVAAADVWTEELDNRPQQAAGHPDAKSEAGNLLEACYDLLYGVRREQAAQAKVLEAIAEKSGLTAAEVEAAAKAGAAEAVAELTITIT
jgi:N-acetyl-anhydromuramyl-L-alanine amidase AmpD